MGWAAITPGAPGFLQIALRSAGQIQMQHQAHISTIHTHPERHGGHQHRGLGSRKWARGALSHIWLKTSVIGDGLNTVGTKAFRPLLHGPTRARINQAGAPCLLKGLQHIGQGILGPTTHGVVQIVAARGTNLNQRTPQMQQAQDVGPDPGAAVALRATIGTPGHRLLSCPRRR